MIRTRYECAYTRAVLARLKFAQREIPSPAQAPPDANPTMLWGIHKALGVLITDLQRSLKRYDYIHR